MNERYQFTNGWTMKREANRPFFWILSDESCRQIDLDQYRHDLISRHRLTVESYDASFEDMAPTPQEPPHAG